jgi:hypothetical protein
MKNKKGYLAAGLLALIFGNRIASQEIQLPLSYAQTITKEELPPQNGPFLGTEISFNLESETKPKEIEYDFRSCFDDNDFSSVYSPFISLINNNVNSPLQIPLSDIKNLTDNQKLVFLSILSNQMNSLTYNIDTNCCRHISSNIEKIAGQLELSAAVVSGIIGGGGHAYNLIKTGDGVSVVDSYDILSSKSKNVEKVLEAYQSEMNYPMFKQDFYKESKFRYALLTKDGKNFLDLIGYNPSLDVIKESLQNRNEHEPNFNFEGNVKDNFFSFFAGFFGTYFKTGKMKENLSQREIFIAQEGIKPKFTIKNIMSIAPEISFVYGKMENSHFISLPFGLTLATENKKGINFSTRFSHTTVNIKEATLYHNMAIDAGVSYSFKIKDARFEPYVLSQASNLVENLEEYSKRFRFNELEAGLKLSLPLKDGTLIFEPHYTKRIWEDELGAKLRIGTGKINGNLEAAVSKSNYEFCPNKLRINSGIDLSFGDLSFTAGYKAEGTDYDGEKELTSSFYLNGKIKLK